MQYTPLGSVGSDDFPSPTDDLESIGMETSSLSSSVSSKKKKHKTKNLNLVEPLTQASFHEDENGHAVDVEEHPLEAVEDDPFYVFKEDLLRKLSIVEESLDRYLHLVHNTDTAVNVYEMKEWKKQLKRHIKNGESTLKDLETTVTLVQKNRTKFNHIDDVELEERRILVGESRDRLIRCKDEMNSDEVKRKIVSDERALASRRAGNLSAKTELEKENSDFVVNSATEAQLMLRQQDETLEELDEAVTRVGNIAGEINTELGAQNKMLTELEDDLQDAEEKLGLVMGKLGKMLKTKSKCQLGTIIVLTLIVLVLFFLVIYT